MDIASIICGLLAHLFAKEKEDEERAFWHRRELDDLKRMTMYG